MSDQCHVEPVVKTATEAEQSQIEAVDSGGVGHGLPQLLVTGA